MTEEQSSSTAKKDGGGLSDADRRALLEPKTAEVEFEGITFKLKALAHHELIASQKQAREWVKRDPSIELEDAAGYVGASKALLYPKFTPEELRLGDSAKVNVLIQKVNELCFLRLRKSDFSPKLSGSEKEEQSNPV
jgi:hypothetical protein